MNRGRIRGIIVGETAADRVVPRSGFTAQLTLFASGAMAFLAVFALALSVSAGRLADRWSSELARAATLRISAPAETRARQTETALAVLRQTPGVASARPLDTEEQRALLAPWLGADLPIESLPVPQLIEIIADDDGYDAQGLRLRLSAELPGAVLDDHTRWRQPLISAAQSLRRLGWLSILLIGGAMAAMITLAANAALAANAQIIDVLRLVGARDRFIAHAFVRRFTYRALIGGGAGTVLAMLCVAFLPAASDEGGFLTGLGFRGAAWFVPILIPFLGAAVAFAATAIAARRRLAEVT